MYLPAEYSSDGIPSLVSCFSISEDKASTVTVYNENLENVAEVHISGLPEYASYEIAYADEFEFDTRKEIDRTQYNNIPLTDLHIYIEEWLGPVEYELKETDDYTFVIPVYCERGDYALQDFFEYDIYIYGTKYPARGILLKDYGEVIGGVYFRDWWNCYIPTHWGSPEVLGKPDFPGTSGLKVTDMGGRTVFSTLLPEDGIYQIPGSVMSHGMNSVTVTPPDSTPVSTKVLVK